MFNPNLNIGDIINNEMLCRIFRCGPQGGMRKSNATRTLVIIANYVKGIYHDKWIGGVLHYTGMGLYGDQGLDDRQNYTLNHAKELGVDVFLFEVMEEREYTYCGRVEMVAEAYPDTQPDSEGKKRRVWVFPVKPVPDNDVKKPDRYVFKDMDDYKARGENIDEEFTKITPPIKTVEEPPIDIEKNLKKEKPIEEKIVFTPFEVVHDKMGNGTAIGYCEKEETTYIKIRFSDHEIQDFVFPDQFQWHLKATEPEIQSQIERILKKRPILEPNRPFLRIGSGIFHRAIDTYDYGCEKFGWDPKKRGSFDRRRILYAANATPEGYAVWCLPHNDERESYNEEHNWYNYIDGDHIVEVWFIDKPDFYYDDSIRVTFIKNIHNIYEFRGIYRPIKHDVMNINGKKQKVKIYKRISTKYPD